MIPHTNTAIHSTNTNGQNLERELNIFFERAAQSGSETTKKLSTQERAERAILGAEIEDEIFASKDRIVELG